MNARVQGQATLSFIDWMQTIQLDMEGVLDRFLPAASLMPARLHEAMRYTALDGGKRVRPLLVYAAGALFDAAWEGHLPR